MIEIEGLKPLLDEYGKLRENPTRSWLDIAKIEVEIWGKVSEHHGKGVTKIVGERRDWFHNRYGGTSVEYDLRSGIYNAGAWAHPLFEMIDTGQLTLGQASACLRIAKQLNKGLQDADHDLSLKEALRQVTVRKRKRPGARRVLTTAATQEEPSEAFSGSKTESSKEFGRKMEWLGEKFVEAQFTELYVEEYHKAKLIKDFKTSLHQLVEELRYSIKRTKDATVNEGIEEVGEPLFNWACEVLGLSIHFEDPVDMKKAQRIRIQRMRDLHPDRNPSKAAESEYRAVNDAFSILEKYSMRHNKKGRK